MNIKNNFRSIRIPMDKLGRICIPVSIRRYLGLTPGRDAELAFTDHGVLLQAPEDRCALCGATDRLELICSAGDGPRYLCPDCQALIREKE